MWCGVVFPPKMDKDPEKTVANGTNLIILLENNAVDVHMFCWLVLVNSCGIQVVKASRYTIFSKSIRIQDSGKAPVSAYAA